MSDQNETRRVAGLEATVGFATLVIKSLILINGGALIALLAFLGNIAGKGHKISQNVNSPFELYSWGLGLAIVSAMLAYVFQAIVTETTCQKLALGLRIVACVIAVSSLGFFIRGCFSSIHMFSSLNFS